MQIVINISEERYKNIKEQVDKRDYPDMQIGRAIADGVLIPECHGKLVDIDLLRDQVSHDEREAFSKHQVWLLLSVYNKDLPIRLDADEAYKNRNRVIGVDLNHVESAEFHCGFEESGGHAYNCNDCPNKCEEWYQWEKEMKK